MQKIFAFFNLKSFAMAPLLKLKIVNFLYPPALPLSNPPKLSLYNNGQPPYRAKSSPKPAPEKSPAEPLQSIENS